MWPMPAPATLGRSRPKFASSHRLVAVGSVAAALRAGYLAHLRSPFPGSGRGSVDVTTVPDAIWSLGVRVDQVRDNESGTGLNITPGARNVHSGIIPVVRRREGLVTAAGGGGRELSADATIMSRVVYSDESVRGPRFYVAAAVVPSAAIGELNQAVRRLHLPGQRRLHMSDERDARQRQILAAIVGLGPSVVQGWLYVAPRPVLYARDLCLGALVDDLADNDVGRLILDRVDEQQNRRDRVVLAAALRKQGIHLRYEHAATWEHPGLQVADVLAWAYGAGGDWRRRTLPIIGRVNKINP